MLRYATDLGIVAAPCLCGKKESGPVGRLTTFLLFCRITNVGYRLFMTITQTISMEGQFLHLMSVEKEMMNVKLYMNS